MRLIGFFLVLVFVLSMGFVSANESSADIINDADVVVDDSLLIDDISQSVSIDVNASRSDVDSYVFDDGSMEDGSSYGDWYELKMDIQNLQPGDVYNLTKDYIKPDSEYLEGIDIKTDNVTINGNGHVIKGSIKKLYRFDNSTGDVGINNKGNIFTVTGNNVLINNSIISGAGAELHAFDYGLGNFEKDYCVCNFSPICWIGNDGICSNCIFRDNKAFNGGSISWLGDNGVLSYATFINSSADRVGSAVYLRGDNFTWFNMTAVDLHSGWVEFYPIYYGAFDAFCPSYYEYIFDNRIDLTEYLFYSTNGIGFFTLNNLTFYAEVVENDLNLVFSKECYDKGIKFILCESLHFYDVYYENLTADKFMDNIFMSLQPLAPRGTAFSFNAFYNVTDISSYNKAIDLTASIFNDYKKKYLGNACCSCGLHVDILTSLVDAKTWHPKDSGFDVIYIDGHGNNIAGGSKSSQEYKFANVEGSRDYMFMVSNITISGFNNAFVNNGGYSILDNVMFYRNVVHYTVDQDWGAAIKNAGVTICNNCSFMYNECSNGGAIFNQGILSLNACSFYKNHASGKGNDVLNVDKGSVTLNGTNVDVVYKKSLSTVWKNVIKYGSMGLSFAAGLATGLLTFNPVVGVAVGAGVALALGVGASAAIAKTNYNMYYNVAKSTAIIITGNVGAGILGGLTGGMIGQAMLANGLINEFNAVAQGVNPIVYSYISAAIKSATTAYSIFVPTSIVYSEYLAAMIISDVRGDAAHAAHVGTGDYIMPVKYNGSIVSHKI